jgi:catechol 2,3-dioxygenase-like lactoylglutathione lyase family enzyme
MKKYRMHMLIVAGIVGGCIIMAGAKQTGPKAEFSRTTIDLGMVVSDVEKTAKFYTEAVGFTELKGFDVAAQMANDTGLADGVTPVKEPYQLGGNSYLVLVKDPDGNTVELIGPRP